jgi:hypothetical protein
MLYTPNVAPSGAVSARTTSALDVPQTLDQARKEAFDLYWTAGFLAFGVVVGFGRTIYCARKKGA